MRELTRENSSETQILMSWIEPVAKGRKARIHLLIEERYDLKESYESVRDSIHAEPDPGLKLKSAPTRKG